MRANDVSHVWVADNDSYVVGELALVVENCAIGATEEQHARAVLAIVHRAHVQSRVACATRDTALNFEHQIDRELAGLLAKMGLQERKLQTSCQCTDRSHFAS